MCFVRGVNYVAICFPVPMPVSCRPLFLLICLVDLDLDVHVVLLDMCIYFLWFRGITFSYQSTLFQAYELLISDDLTVLSSFMFTTECSYHFHWILTRRLIYGNITYWLYAVSVVVHAF